MKVDLHSPTPAADYPNVSVDRLRVKNAASLGAAGVHGRLNAEAVGADRLPATFEVDDLVISVPNPLTWSIMKLVAVEDRLNRAARDEPGEANGRAEQQRQAAKHAQDVCRIIAMMSRDERDRTAEVVAAVSGSPAFARAADVSSAQFGSADGWAIKAVRREWRADDLRTIQAVLKSWFG